MADQPNARQTFPGIDAAAFEHPLDRAALEALRKTPGLALLFKKLGALGPERQVRLFFTADSLRISPRQLPAIYELHREACATLDVPEPDLFLFQDPRPNAFAIGMERFTIVLSSGLVELLDADELRSVIGHELGHVKSGHMLYRTIAIFLWILGDAALRRLPIMSLINEAIALAMYDWMRKSELTADRAALLVAQDQEHVKRTLLKLAAGKAGQDASTEEFVRQADDYEDMDTNLLDLIYKFDMTRFQTHPFPALRAREVQRWAASPEYGAILGGAYPRADGTAAAERRCGACGARIGNVQYRFCPECGSAA